MIEASTGRSEAFSTRLTVKAEALGRAYAEARMRARRRDPLRWRLPALLWPLFAKEK